MDFNKNKGWRKVYGGGWNEGKGGEKWQSYHNLKNVLKCHGLRHDQI